MECKADAVYVCFGGTMQSKASSPYANNNIRYMLLELSRTSARQICQLLIRNKLITITKLNKISFCRQNTVIIRTIYCINCFGWTLTNYILVSNSSNYLLLLLQYNTVCMCHFDSIHIRLTLAKRSFEGVFNNTKTEE